METIPQKELRNQVGEILRRAEGGEEFTITVSGRPVAHLGPTQLRRWVGGPALAAVFSTLAPASLASDLERFPASLSEPPA